MILTVIELLAGCALGAGSVCALVGIFRAYTHRGRHQRTKRLRWVVMPVD